MFVLPYLSAQMGQALKLGTQERGIESFQISELKVIHVHKQGSRQPGLPPGP